MSTLRIMFSRALLAEIAFMAVVIIVAVPIAAWLLDIPTAGSLVIAAVGLIGYWIGRAEQ